MLVFTLNQLFGLFYFVDDDLRHACSGNFVTQHSRVLSCIRSVDFLVMCVFLLDHVRVLFIQHVTGRKEYTLCFLLR